MAAGAHDQLEILRRVGAGLPLGDGDVPLPTLQDEITMLVALHLIVEAGDEPMAPPYRLTEIGAQVLAATAARRICSR